jgi:hypothetical protein
MNLENIIILLLSVYILYIDKNRIICSKLLDNEITKITILFFIIFNFNNYPIISLLTFISYVLTLKYINDKKLEVINNYLILMR